MFTCHSIESFYASISWSLDSLVVTLVLVLIYAIYSMFIYLFLHWHHIDHHHHCWCLYVVHWLRNIFEERVTHLTGSVRVEGKLWLIEKGTIYRSRSYTIDLVRLCLAKFVYIVLSICVVNRISFGYYKRKCS